MRAQILSSLLLLPALAWADTDGDGYEFPQDCNDADGSIHPGAAEIPADGVDQDCDGFEYCFQDRDGDHFGGASLAASRELSCLVVGLAANGLDCNDTDNRVNPGAVEYPGDVVDSNCDGLELCYEDVDGDGYGAGALVSIQGVICVSFGLAPANDDCGPENPAVHPFAPEACDDIDNDCDGIIDNLERRWFADRDLDGYGNSAEYTDACPTQSLPTLGGGGRWVLLGGDCDDTAATIHPGRAEFCDGEDNDCDGTVDNNLPQFTLWHVDGDHDGFGRTTGATTQGACPPGNDYDSYSPFNTDCKDSDDTVHPLVTAATQSHPPLADEPEEFSEYDRSPAYVGDGIDQDCDGGDLCYPDLDGDGFGDPGVAGGSPSLVEDDDLVCDNGSSLFTSSNQDDCDDGNPLINPDQPEIAGDGYDQNCDGRDLCYRDEDGDGYGSEILVQAPGVVCGEGDDKSASKAGDCDDSLSTGPLIFPSNAEVCDGIDNNCNGEVDEVSSPDAITWFLDADGDSWGDVRYQLRTCGQPIGYVASPGDCNDAETRTFPTNTEICDGIDNNCVMGIDEQFVCDADTDTPLQDDAGCNGASPWGGAYAFFPLLIPLSWRRRRGAA